MCSAGNLAVPIAALALGVVPRGGSYPVVFHTGLGEQRSGGDNISPFILSLCLALRSVPAGGGPSIWVGGTADVNRLGVIGQDIWPQWLGAEAPLDVYGR